MTDLELEATQHHVTITNIETGHIVARWYPTTGLSFWHGDLGQREGIAKSMAVAWVEYFWSEQNEA